MEIKTVAVLGAGAVGSYFIAGLAGKLQDRLWVIADNSRKERLEKEGIIINQKTYLPHVKTPAQAKGVDLLLVALKYNSLLPCLDTIREIVGEHTIVMSLMNGIDSEEIIGNAVGDSHIVYSMIKIASERRDNTVVYDEDATQGVFFGEPENSEKTFAVARLFDGSNVKYVVCEDIITAIWSKYALNISKNIPQAIIGCGFGAYYDSVYVAKLSQLMRSEVVAVAAAKGIDIADENTSLGNSDYVTKKARFSTLQDLDSHRHTEIDMFCKALVKLGHELGVPTPYNEFAYNVIKALEEKNDGRFDY